MVPAISVSVLTVSSSENVGLVKSWKSWLWLASLLIAGTITAIPARAAAAHSMNSLVFVSVQMVESCRVDAIAHQTGAGLRLQMRCNSAARPAVGLENNAAASGQATPVGSVQMATTVTGARAVSTVSLVPAAGQILRIDF